MSDKNVVAITPAIQQAMDQEEIKRRYREQKKAERDAEARANMEETLGAAASWLNANPTCYVQRQDRYYMRRVTGEWEPINPRSMRNGFQIWRSNPDFGDAVTMLLEARGLRYHTVTYSFRTDLPSDVKNLMNIDFLEPDLDNPPHPFFETFLRSLGGGKIENIEHIERVILHKYLKPETYTLPCIVFHGEGGTGKNVLVDDVLPIVFHGKCASMKTSEVLGAFNGRLKGMAAVLINEAENDKTNESELKHLLQRKELTINMKGIEAFDVDNTPLYFIGSNKSEGGVWLDRSRADRRLSIIHTQKGQYLEYWIARQMGWIDESKTKLDADNNTEDNAVFIRAHAWFVETGLALLRNPIEVAKWLGSLYLKHGEKGEPQELHGEDFRRLLDVQKPPHEGMFEAVFGSETFTHIERRTLWEGYQAICRDANRKPMGKHRFMETARQWIAVNKPNITEPKDGWMQGRDRLHVRGFRDETTDGWRNPNHSDYMTDGYTPRWIGPEV